MTSKNTVNDNSIKKIPVPESLKELLSNSKLGGTRERRESLGHIKLTHGAQRYFNITRFPTHPERFHSLTNNTLRTGIENEITKIDESEWISIIDGIKYIYNETQANLKRSYPGGKVTLKRNLIIKENGNITEYGEYICGFVHQAKTDEKKPIEFMTDIVTGWCLYDPGSQYGEFEIVHEFPIEDILLYSNHLIEGGGLESDEWLVLNRNSAGILKLSPSDIKINVNTQKCLDYKNINHSSKQKYIIFPVPKSPYLHPVKGTCGCYCWPWYVKWAIKFAKRK